jgi:hypothetical protein
LSFLLAFDQVSQPGGNDDVVVTAGTADAMILGWGRVVLFVKGVQDGTTEDTRFRLGHHRQAPRWINATAVIEDGIIMQSKDTTTHSGIEMPNALSTRKAAVAPKAIQDNVLATQIIRSIVLVCIVRLLVRYARLVYQ